jgi:transposase
MAAKKYVVTLEPEEREHLDGLVRSGKRSARAATHARIPLLADAADGGPAWDDARIAEALRCGVRTVERVRQRLVEQGLEPALGRKPQDRPSRERTLDGAAEARLIALACSGPPDGRTRWTLKLLADKLVELEVVQTISDETVRRALKKTSLRRIGSNSG